jgi:diaminohydroxyphosphoribosylaminopyrimidine deaminase/5-amino-6-(5-phosphoribosylamino)uracil reductase
MSLDGKTATVSGESQWISGETSREFVHRLRGRMDAILIGGGTAQSDDPLLTARPAGPRTATRVVFDSRLEVSPESRLVRSVDQAPVLLVAHDAPAERKRVLESLGCEVLETSSPDATNQIRAVLDELGSRGTSNVLLEGGAKLAGSFFDAGEIDEVVAFVAAKLIGGSTAATPIAGAGISKIADVIALGPLELQRFGADLCIRARISRGTIR